MAGTQASYLAARRAPSAVVAAGASRAPRKFGSGRCLNRGRLGGGRASGRAGESARGAEMVASLGADIEGCSFKKQAQQAASRWAGGRYMPLARYSRSGVHTRERTTVSGRPRCLPAGPTDSYRQADRHSDSRRALAESPRLRWPVGSRRAADGVLARQRAPTELGRAGSPASCQPAGWSRMEPNG